MTILIATHIYEFVEALIPTGIEIHVPDNAKRQKPSCARNVHVVPNLILEDASVAERYIEENKIDIVYAQGRGTMCFFAKVRRRMHGRYDFRILATIHTGYVWEVWWKSLAFLVFARLNSDGVIFLSQVHRKRYGWFSDLIGLKTWVVRNPVDMGRFPHDHVYRIDKSHLCRLGYVGIITPNKRQDVLIETVALMHEQGYNVHLTLVGDVQYEWYLELLQKRIQDCDLRDWVRIKPGIPYNEIPEFMYSIDCYVCPSKIEVLPFNILEAMAAGLPVVAMQVGGIPDLVRSGENGAIVYHCKPEEFLTAIGKIIQHSKFVDYGRRSRQSAQDEFSNNCFARLMGNVFTEILSE